RLQAAYDRPAVAHLRTARLRRLLRLPPLWSELLWTALAWVGWLPAAAMLYWMLTKGPGFKLDSNYGYGLLGLIGLWGLVLFKHLAWDKLALMRLARRVRRQLRV